MHGQYSLWPHWLTGVRATVSQQTERNLNRARAVATDEAVVPIEWYVSDARRARRARPCRPVPVVKPEPILDNPAMALANIGAAAPGPSSDRHSVMTARPED